MEAPPTRQARRAKGPRSLSFRLVVTSSVWLSVALLVAGVLLVWLFRGHIERRFDATLFDHLWELVAAGEITPGGSLALRWVPTDPRFNRPLSGWYWQVMTAGGVLHQSESGWSNSPIVRRVPETSSRARFESIEAPDGTSLRVLVQGVSFPESDFSYAFVIAGPVADVDADVVRFAARLALTLGVLGAGLLLAVAIQVRFGLRPLRSLRDALAEVRSGRRERLPGDFPADLKPTVSEFNALLDHNATLLERARTQAGNLAHALKTPLSVLAYELREVPGEHGQRLREKLSAVEAELHSQLARARAAGERGAAGARTPVAELVDDLVFSLKRIHGDRTLEFQVEGVDRLVFHGDGDDLAEMLGNLLDNACKWAARRVRVTGALAGEYLTLQVDDDGPGVPAAAREEVLERGRRLDEATPGSGLGLGIVRDIVALYRGDLALGESPLGGLRATLRLPAAI